MNKKILDITSVLHILILLLPILSGLNRNMGIIWKSDTRISKPLINKNGKFFNFHFYVLDLTLKDLKIETFQINEFDLNL